MVMKAYLDAATGKGMAGRGSVSLDEDGITLIGSGMMWFKDLNIIRGYIDSDGNGLHIFGHDHIQISPSDDKDVVIGHIDDVSGGLLRPYVTGSRDLGSPTFKWGAVYANDFYGTSHYLELRIDDPDPSITGQIWFRTDL